MTKPEKKNGYGKFVIRFRWLILPLSIILTLLAASGGRFLSFSTDYRVFFSKENPELVAFEALQNTYTKNDNVLFALAPKDGKVFTQETLAVVEELTKKAWQIPFSIRVDSITNFQYTRAEGDDLIIEDLVSDAGNLTDEEIQNIMYVALSEPLLLNRLIPVKAHVTGVNVTIQLQGNAQDEVTQVVKYVRDMADDIRNRHPDMDVYLSGMVMMNNAFAEAAQGDMKTLVPAMFLIVIIVTWLLTRSVAGTLSTVLVIIFSTIAAMGLAGWLGITLSGPTMNAPTIILTLAVADCIHVLVAMFTEMRRGSSKHEAIIESLRINMQPVFLTSITTAIGFLSMNFSDAPPFRDLGNIVAMGVMVAWLNSIFLLPVIMSILPVRVKPVSRGNQERINRFCDFVIEKRKKLFWGMLVAIVIFTSGILRIELNDVFTEYFDERYAFRTDTDFILENLTGIYFIDYSLNSGKEDGINNPEYLETVEKFAQWFRSQPEVLHVNTITDVLKRLNRNMHADDDTYYRIPVRNDLAAQYMLLYEMSVPFGLDLNNQINVHKSSTRFTVTLETLSTKDLLRLEKSAQQWLIENAPQEMRTPGASPSIMFAHIAERNVKSMLAGTTLALVLISAILVLAMKSLKIGFISLAPNIVPAAMGFGLWGILFVQVGLALSVVAAMTLGIVVDDTVHFLSKYLRARREHGMNTVEAVRYSFRTVGTAIVITSVILIAGFTVLTFSGFQVNSGMGKLTAITIVFALLTDFLFLPPLLMKLEEKIK